MEIRMIKKADLDALEVNTYGQSMRGLAVEDAGEILAVAGVLHSDPYQAFSKMKDELRRSPKTIVKTAKAFRMVLDKYSTDIFAIASPDESNSEGFLKFVGFEFKEETAQGRIFQWIQ